MMALLTFVLFPSSLFAARNVARQKQLAREQFAAAERKRSTLNEAPADERTLADYRSVIEAYRRVYYTSPTSNKADAAVTAVAELLAETGRKFNDPHLLRSAIGQYEFLRREYPGSKYRVKALFLTGQIYKDDLNDSAQARTTFQEYLKRYPRSQLAAAAREALAEIDHPSEIKKSAKTQKSRPARPEKSTTESPDQEVVIVRPQDAQEAEAKAEKRASLPLVTGIRHWSTPDYTRVAIDLDSEVKYEAGRIPDPDRIFFDLHDTHLSAALTGKTFQVDDGFLRKIRVAQYQRGMTRVVLDVSDVSDYSAFLLPNPYRLIIDIHGKKVQKPDTLVAQKAAEKQALHSPEQASVNEKPIPSAPRNETASAKLPQKDAEIKNGSGAQPKASQVSRDTSAQVAAQKISNLEQNLKKTEEATKAEDATINVAKATQPELKATPEPTTSPTFKSVAPREASSPRNRKRTTAGALTREARPTANGEVSLIRALGLKIGRIVVDAGHGGHDTGTIGPKGLQEKDLVLDVALRLGKLLQNQMGAEVVFTRDDDTFIPLETRTAIANQAQADLFISVHANSSRDPSARGVETYYLNFTSSPDALEVAARENSVSQKSIHELQDLVKKITLKEKIDESREFAADVQRSLYSGIAAKSPAVRNRGVKKAPFIVLIGANMPSILAEISFLSNPTDERRLQTPEYRQKIAEYIYKGTARYISGLSGLKVAADTTSPARSITNGGANR